HDKEKEEWQRREKSPRATSRGTARGCNADDVTHDADASNAATWARTFSTAAADWRGSRAAASMKSRHALMVLGERGPSSFSVTTARLKKFPARLGSSCVPNRNIVRADSRSPPSYSMLPSRNNPSAAAGSRRRNRILNRWRNLGT